MGVMTSYRRKPVSSTNNTESAALESGLRRNDEAWERSSLPLGRESDAPIKARHHRAGRARPAKRAVLRARDPVIHEPQSTAVAPSSQSRCALLYVSSIGACAQ